MDPENGVSLPPIGDSGRPVAGIDSRPGRTNAATMSSAPHLFDEPPLVSPSTPPLKLLPGGDVERLLSEAEALTRDNAHGAALEQLESLWPDVRHIAPLALRHRLASAWAQ